MTKLTGNLQNEGYAQPSCNKVNHLSSLGPCVEGDTKTSFRSADDEVSLEAHLCGEGLGHGGQAEELMREREVGVGVAAAAAGLRAQEV